MRGRVGDAGAAALHGDDAGLAAVPLPLVRRVSNALLGRGTHRALKGRTRTATLMASCDSPRVLTVDIAAIINAVLPVLGLLRAPTTFQRVIASVSLPVPRRTTC